LTSGDNEDDKKSGWLQPHLSEGKQQNYNT